MAPSPSRRLAPIACVLLLAAAAAAAPPTQPGFVLRTSQTFAPGQTPKIDVQFRQIGYLDFRIYRVADPAAFFAGLKNPHQFGGPPPNIPQTPTLLERWHGWKRAAGGAWHDFLRRQFSRRVREAYLARGHSGKYRQIPIHVSAFAAVPLLNRRQLVLSWRELIPKTRDWESRTIPCPLTRPGLYLAEAVSGELRAYTLVFITRLGVVTKAARGQLLVFAADRDTGQPRAGVHVYLRADMNPFVMRATGADGTASFVLGGQRPRDWIVLASAGDDVAASDLPSWDFSSATIKTIRGYLYTDRPVYKPGQTVAYKGILRRRIAGHYQLPSAPSVAVTFTDANGKTLEVQHRPLNPFGAFSGTLQLPITAALGLYGFRAAPADATGDDDIQATGSFSVEDYHRPAYYVTVSPASKWLLQGGTQTFEIHSAYYYGAPVANAKLHWQLLRSVYWSDWFGDFEQSVPWTEYEYGTPVDDGDGRLDAQGAMRLALPIPLDPHQLDLTYTLRVTVTDAAGRPINGSGSFQATYASFRAGLSSDQDVYAAGQVASFTLQARDYQDRPVAARFQVQLETVAPAPQVLSTTTTETDAKGSAQFTLPMPGSGNYQVVATAADSNGRAVSASTWLWVFGGGGGVQYSSMQLIADRHSYQPGQTARILVQIPAPLAAGGPHWLWVTTERDRVYSRFVQKTSGPTATLDIPIADVAVPGIYVTATALSHDQLITGSLELKVPPTQEALHVSVEAAKSQYLPHATATVTVSARDASGHPVAADVSLAVVDESVYAVEPDHTPEILKSFYGDIYDQVDTEFSTDYWFSGWSGRDAMRLARLRRPYSLADFKGARLVQPQVRKDFRETAYWAADLITSADGQATASFQLPDSLTQWRITARAMTRDTRAGQAVSHFVTRKNVILQLVLPHFAVQGDRWTTYSIVHNYLPKPVAVRATLATVPDAAGVLLDDAAPRQFTLPAGGEQRAAWPLQAVQAGPATLLGQALTPVESDALELPLEVWPNGIRLDDPRSGALRELAQADETWQLPPAAPPGASYLSLRLAPSLVGTMFSALDYLLQYPYGCTEQTTSAMIGSLAVEQALSRLGGVPPATQQLLLPRVRAGLDRLANSQNSDGGWGWWPSTPTDPYMTAEAVTAVAEAEQAGFSVKPALLAQGRAAVDHLLDQYPRMTPELRAYLLQAAQLTGPIAPQYLEPLWSQRAQLSAYGQASLVLILAAQHDPRAAGLAQALIARASQNAEQAWWPANFDPLLEIWDDDGPETTAHVLRALVAARMPAPIEEKAVRWLADHAGDGYWYSTKQTAEVMTALAAYAQNTNELHPDYRVSVSLDGKVAYQGRFTAADVERQPVELRLPVASGPVKLSIARQGAGVLYWSADLVTYSTAADDVHRGGFDLNVLRQYFRLQSRAVRNADGTQQIVYQPEALNGPLRPGDLVLVDLTVSGGFQRYLLVEDPIPAGAEPVKNDDAMLTAAASPWWMQRDFRDDRVSFFQSVFGPGQEHLQYVLRVVLPGRFQALPTRAAPMYDPSKLATGTSRSFDFEAGSNP